MEQERLNNAIQSFIITWKKSKITLYQLFPSTGGGMITFLALARMLDATQLVWGGWVEGDANIPCTCTHVGCYATRLGWVGGGG